VFWLHYSRLAVQAAALFFMGSAASITQLNATEVGHLLVEVCGDDYRKYCEGIDHFGFTGKWIDGLTKTEIPDKLHEIGVTTPEHADRILMELGKLKLRQILDGDDKTHVFLSHNWGTGNANHTRVMRVNEELKKRGLVTWMDTERMEGSTLDAMANGIDNTCVVIVFITSAYRDKVNGTDLADNCKKEFNFASQSKPNALIPVVMEAEMRTTADWHGPLAMTLGTHLYVDMVSDEEDVFTAQCDKLFQSVCNVLEKQFGGTLMSSKTREYVRNQFRRHSNPSSPSSHAVPVSPTTDSTHASPAKPQTTPASASDRSPSAPGSPSAHATTTPMSVRKHSVTESPVRDTKDFDVLHAKLKALDEAAWQGDAEGCWQLFADVVAEKAKLAHADGVDASSKAAEAAAAGTSVNTTAASRCSLEYYQGDVDGTRGLPHGLGIGSYPDDSRYAGQWKHGKRDGYGVVTQLSETSYAGLWRDDVFLRGTCSAVNYVYEGDFLNLEFHGFGRRTERTGDFHIFVGEWRHNVKEVRFTSFQVPLAPSLLFSLRLFYCSHGNVVCFVTCVGTCRAKASCVRATPRMQWCAGACGKPTKRSTASEAAAPCRDSPLCMFTFLVTPAPPPFFFFFFLVYCVLC